MTALPCTTSFRHAQWKGSLKLYLFTEKERKEWFGLGTSCNAVGALNFIQQQKSLQHSLFSKGCCINWVCAHNAEVINTRKGVAKKS